MRLSLCVVATVLAAFFTANVPAEDFIRNLQENAIETESAEFGRWGWEKTPYIQWSTHSNRLIPVYTYGTLGAGEGVDLNSYIGDRSAYRSEAALRQIYGELPVSSVNPAAEYMDQTNIFDIQKAALKAGKKQIILIVFDGMDWQTTQAASIYKTQEVAYKEGRGKGLHLQNFTANDTTQFGSMVTSPSASKARTNVNDQTVEPAADATPGGYSYEIGGPFPWSTPTSLEYLIGKPAESGLTHAYPDSAATATSMTSGHKTYNGSINITPHGEKTTTIAHLAQRAGYKVGVVSAVPISHATPAAAYSHNVSRNDYQDLTRDLLGLPSVSHPHKALPGVDVLIGAGWGATKGTDKGQGDNYVPGNRYLAEEDRQKADERSGGPYVYVERMPGMDGTTALAIAAADASSRGKRLFGYFGVPRSAGDSHLPYRTANGDYKPTAGVNGRIDEYTEADIVENPTLAEMTDEALNVLSYDHHPFWLMVEAGDVDWANHENNIDNSIGAVLSGDAAVKKVTNWVELNSSWDDAVVIVTADHGHYLVLDKPELLTGPAE